MKRKLKKIIMKFVKNALIGRFKNFDKSVLNHLISIRCKKVQLIKFFD